MDSDNTTVAGAQGGSSSAMKKKRQVGNVKLLPRSVVYNTQELRMTLPNQISHPSPMWSYHPNWSDDLSLQHIIPPSPLNSHQSQLELGHLGTANSGLETPLFVPEMPSPDIPNRESRPMGFGRGSDRGVGTPCNSSPTPDHG